MKQQDKLRAMRGLRTVTEYLRKADRVLMALHYAREGTFLQRALALASSAGSVLELLTPDMDMESQLKRLGLEPYDTGLASFVFSILHRSGPGETVDSGVDHHHALRFWELGNDAQIAYVVDVEADDLVAGPYLTEGAHEILAERIHDLVWQAGDDLMVVADSSRGRGSRRRRAPGDGADNYSVVPMPDPGVFYGEPGLDWYVKRMRHHGDRCRSMLLVGPTGVGKSTLARLIARQLEDGGRVLKLSNHVTRLCSVADILDFVKILKPTVLLLDDADLIDEAGSHYRPLPPMGGQGRMLELMEALHGEARLVIATVMKDRGIEGEDTPHAARRRRRSVAQVGTAGAYGLNYFSGMRPGRVDEVVRVKRPNKRVRRKILLHYLGGEETAAGIGIAGDVLTDVVARTEHLTGAYLAEVAYRLRVHGIQTYKTEIANVVATCPFDPSGRQLRRRRRPPLLLKHRVEKKRRECLKRGIDVSDFSPSAYKTGKKAMVELEERLLKAKIENGGVLPPDDRPLPEVDPGRVLLPGERPGGALAALHDGITQLQKIDHDTLERLKGLSPEAITRNLEGLEPEMAEEFLGTLRDLGLSPEGLQNLSPAMDVAVQATSDTALCPPAPRSSTKEGEAI